MWNLFFNPFQSNKTSNDGTPSPPPANSVPTLRSNGTPSRLPTNLVPKRHKIYPAHDKDSFDSNHAHDSNLPRPPSTKNTSLSALNMEAIYNTA